MRRSQSVRNQPRPSLALISDDLGVLREGDESNEDVLRKQLIEKDRECDRVSRLSVNVQFVSLFVFSSYRPKFSNSKLSLLKGRH